MVQYIIILALTAVILFLIVIGYEKIASIILTYTSGGYPFRKGRKTLVSQPGDEAIVKKVSLFSTATKAGLLKFMHNCGLTHAILRHLLACRQPIEKSQLKRLLVDAEETKPRIPISIFFNVLEILRESGFTQIHSGKWEITESGKEIAAALIEIYQPKE